MKPVLPLPALVFTAVFAALLVGGCGGSGGDDDPASSPTPTPIPSEAAPAIATGPTDQTIVAGGTASFRVVARGSGLTYQWYRSMLGIAAPIDDARAPIYATPSTSVADNGAVYYVVVTNAAGSARSGDARLTVGSPLAKPRITAQPNDVEIDAGASLSLSVVASDAQAYQWYRGATAIAGATESTYAVASVAASDAGRYYVAVRNATGTVSSRTVAVTIR